MTRYPDKQRSRVVLIGSSDYELSEQLPNLRAVRNNLTALEEVLTAPNTGGFDGSYCDPVHSPDSPRAFMRRLNRAAREAEDVLLVYYAGHGVLGHDQLYLAVGETNPDLLDGTAVPFEWIKYAIQDSPADVRILILDCCFSGRAIGAMSSDAAALEQIKVEGTFILTSTTANRVSHAFPGERYTAFTGALLELLKERTRAAGPPLTLGGLHAPLKAAMARRHLPSPKCRAEDTAGDLILCRPIPPPPLSQPPPASAPVSPPLTPSPPVLSGRELLHAIIAAGVRIPANVRRVARRGMRTVLGHRRQTDVFVLAVTLLAASLVSAADLPASCSPPMELRVLASPEGSAAIQDASGEFEADSAAGGCRRYHVTVYQAPTDVVLQAFSKAAEWAGGQKPAPTASADPTKDLVPGRDVGPQPDAWFPDSTVDVDRARAAIKDGAVALREPTSVATSPLVLAVPSRVAGKFGDQQRLINWPDLQKSVGEAHLDMVRPSPITSTTGLLQTVALYQDIAGSPSGTPAAALSSALDSEAADKSIRDIEKFVAKQQYPLGDNNDLLCKLPQQAGSEPALLVSEKAVLDYNLHRLPGTGCAILAPSASARLWALYPNGTPSLDHPFVEIDWSGQSDGPRAEALRRFRDWLRGDRGQQVFASAGYRTGTRLDGASPLAEPAAGVWVGARVNTPPPAPDVVNTVVAHYQGAHQPGRVLFLLDVSGSMANEDKLAQAKQTIVQALGLLGKGDAAGLMMVPQSTDSSGPTTLIPLGAAANPADLQNAVRKAVDDRRPINNGAALYDAIGAGLRAMGSSPDAGKQVMVVISDGEDHEGARTLSTLTAAGLNSWQPSGVKIPIDIVAMSPATCEPDLNRVAADSGGHCIQSGQSVNTFVAGVWGGGGA